MGRIGIGSVLFVPLGAGPECLGFLVLSRLSDVAPWTCSWSPTPPSTSAATWVGRRQRPSARSPTGDGRPPPRLDGYRIELVNTVAHELRNPLISVVGNLELLEDEALATHGRRSVESAHPRCPADRASSTTCSPWPGSRTRTPCFDPEPVDLRQVVRDVGGVRPRGGRGRSPSTACPTGRSPSPGPRRAAPDARQPAEQRHEVLRRRDLGRVAVWRARARDRRGPRPRARDLRGGPARPLPRVLPLHQPEALSARHRPRAWSSSTASCAATAVTSTSPPRSVAAPR